MSMSGQELQRLRLWLLVRAAFRGPPRQVRPVLDEVQGGQGARGLRQDAQGRRHELEQQEGVGGEAKLLKTRIVFAAASRRF